MLLHAKQDVTYFYYNCYNHTAVSNNKEECKKIVCSSADCFEFMNVQAVCILVL
jgi:hypothetical protein